ncbi:hypothetical protein AC249_AIPGENE29233 [Exaiptasia diaphana]|nr:hypothetical protein AC249_AIPGENE29233 [Exaiptasia diaphana]
MASTTNSKSDCHEDRKAFSMTTPCGHRFCEPCSQNVFEMDTCPLCHATIDAMVLGFVDRCPYNEAVLATCRDVFSEKSKNIVLTLGNLSHTMKPLIKSRHRYEETRKRLCELQKKNCFGCLFDCPSQKDHDLCMGFENVDDEEYYIELAMERVDNMKMAEYWQELCREKLGLSDLERLKYTSKEWIEETVQSFYGKTAIMKIVQGRPMPLYRIHHEH